MSVEDFMCGEERPEDDPQDLREQLTARAENAEAMVMDLTRRSASARDSIIRLKTKIRFLKERLAATEAELAAEREGRKHDAAKREGMLEMAQALLPPVVVGVDRGVGESWSTHYHAAMDMNSVRWSEPPAPVDGEDDGA